MTKIIWWIVSTIALAFVSVKLSASGLNHTAKLMVFAGVFVIWATTNLLVSGGEQDD